MSNIETLCTFCRHLALIATLEAPFVNSKLTRVFDKRKTKSLLARVDADFVVALPDNGRGDISEEIPKGGYKIFFN
jgi:hypothetical protein